MTHKPPVPAGSQSPYPLHPVPVRHQWAVRPTRRGAEPEQEHRQRSPTGLMIGLGVAAAAAFVLFMRRR